MKYIVEKLNLINALEMGWNFGVDRNFNLYKYVTLYFGLYLK
jgi:hypothetical protein